MTILIRKRWCLYVFDNSGSKLKSVAQALCWIGIILSSILGIITMFQAQFFAGLIRMIAGILSSWIGSLALYGFGELIEKVISIDQKLSAYGQSSNVPVPPRGYTPVSSNAASHTSTSAPAKPSAAPSPVAEPRDYERDAKVLAAGGWRCQCGRVNQPYLTTCNCGRHKWDLENIQQEQQ